MGRLAGHVWVGCRVLELESHLLFVDSPAPVPRAHISIAPPVCLQVDLGEVYQGADRGAHRYRLCSMVCYYGQHYQALVLAPQAGGWLMFDDTRVSRVGGWADVRRKCEAGRIQPSVLFYSLQEREKPVAAAT